MDEHTHRFEHHGVLGTLVEVRIGGLDHATAESIDQEVLAEMLRLQSIFSAHDPASELSHWRRGDLDLQSPELVEVLEAALQWQERSHGAFNPLAGEVTELWASAVERGSPPDEASLAELAARIEAPRFRIVNDGQLRRAEPIGDCSRLNLNAFAKGWIVDRALDVAETRNPSWVCVNAGGDLAHRGAGSVQVGIENPLRPYDNEPPMMVVDLSQAALATSGPARRGFRIAGRWYGHVLDPRTGASVDEITSISVVAATAAEADVLATIAGVRSPADAVDCLHDHGVEGLVVDRNGERCETAGWGALAIRRS